MRARTALPLLFLAFAASASAQAQVDMALTPTPTTPIEHYTYFCAAVAPDGSLLIHSSLSDGVLYCPYGADAATSCAYSPVRPPSPSPHSKLS